jgi:hypothetical protein
VANYTASIDAGQVTLVSNAVCGLAANCDYPQFFWVDAGQQRQFTFKYTLTNGLWGQATATFNVYGPLAPNIVAQVGWADAAVDKRNGLGLYLLGLPFQGLQAGIILTTNAPPALGNKGAYSWVQIITENQVQVRTAAGPGNCVSPVVYPALDTGYPYGTAGVSLFSILAPNDTATDNPGSSLLAGWGESQRVFSATMYLMWNPASAGSIPVPVASIPWQFTGDAINTLAQTGNGTTWTVPCGPGAAGRCAAVAAGTPPLQSFPLWETAYTNQKWNCP